MRTASTASTSSASAAPALRLLVAIVILQPGYAYWDASDRGSDDPYTAAMKMSRLASNDPNRLRTDPDHFKKLFGQLAVEQNQAKAMDETQSKFSKQDLCMVCHGVVVEFEKMMAERVDRTRSQLTTTETLETICHLNRYEFQDPVVLTKREERSRVYGGIAPPIFANACKRVVDAWQDDDDEIEGALLSGASKKNLHQALREKICHRDGGICAGTGVEIEVKGKDSLKVKGVPEEQCGAEGGKKKKKQKKVDPISRATA